MASFMGSVLAIDASMSLYQFMIAIREGESFTWGAGEQQTQNLAERGRTGHQPHQRFLIENYSLHGGWNQTCLCVRRQATRD